MQDKNKEDSEKKYNDFKSIILDKEKFLQDDDIAIDGINKNLHRFLGRNEITLEKNTEGGGYILKRNENTATNLSEGEKTAIALIYFMAKLNENGSEIKNTIVVFDDPISSFDSNHLFNASAFITNNCKDALQLFVFTHNFWFFKLIRDWMMKKKKKETNFYTIKKGEISNADKSIIDYHSEYHFVFKNLIKYQSEQNLTWSDSFAIANCSRRVLESFNSFKMPDTEFKNVLTLSKEYGITDETIDQVYYFLNKYSHLDRIETYENTIENIEQEGIAVVKSVLDIIKKIDPLHFESMEKICN